KDEWGARHALSHVHPVLPIIGHVVATERGHRHWVVAKYSELSRGGCGCFGRHRRAEKSPVLPTERLTNEGQRGCTPSAKEDRGEGDALRILPFWRDGRAVGSRGRKSAVRVRRLIGVALGPRTSLPIDDAVHRGVIMPLPPNGMVRTQGNVRVDGIPT